MMQKAAVLGGDRRQYYLAQALKRCGFSVSCFDVPDTENTNAGLKGVLQDASLVLLPMPAFTSDGKIRSEHGGIPVDAVLEHLQKQVTLIGGGMKATKARLEALGLRTLDYLENEALAVANAVPTAEGAIRIAMQDLPITVSGSKALVIGYGRIGKALADRLHGLHADLTVSARKPEDLAAIENLGLKSDVSGVFLHGLRQYDCIFNTVPAPILAERQLATLKDGCLIVDLASGSGGLGGTLPENVRYVQALGLPGKEAPKTAGELLKDLVLKAVG